MDILFKVLATYALLAIVIGPAWNIAVDKEPWLTISGLFGVSGFAIILAGFGWAVWHFV